MRYKKREWLVTVHKDRQDKVLFERIVISDEEYGMDLLNMFKLASAILKGYIQCAKQTQAYPNIKPYAYQCFLEERAGYGNVAKYDCRYGHAIGSYYVERRGAFEVRFEEVIGQIMSQVS